MHICLLTVASIKSADMTSPSNETANRLIAASVETETANAGSLSIDSSTEYQLNVSHDNLADATAGQWLMYFKHY